VTSRLARVVQYGPSLTFMFTCRSAVPLYYPDTDFDSTPVVSHGRR